jgi:glycosyltransferase involved in cell wall biosynthesis
MSVAVSVLVPVYNVEKTLDRCIQSILNQTFKDFEIVLVNDGSTDNSGQLCDMYAEKYDNIRVIHKENEGLGPTRNVGIREAKGEFIYHCDSDDWLREDLLEKVYKAITETNSDIAVFGYDIFTEKDGNICPYESIKVDDNIFKDSKKVKEFFTEQYFNSFVVLSACNRMCRRSFIIDNELFFPALRRSQDVAYSLLLFDNVERLVTIKESFYCYIVEPGVYKGRSFEEMIEIYCTVYDWASGYFEKWDMMKTVAGQKLVNNVCEQIANYSAYAFTVKYKDDWKKNTKYLIKDKRVKKYFSLYSNDKSSRFMMLFSLGIRLGSPWMLNFVSKLMRSRISE